MRTSDQWHSWDRTPWKHPWLESTNLENIRGYSDYALDYLRSKVTGNEGKNYIFCGNGANNIYQRLVGLKGYGFNTELLLHPHSYHIMDQPCWEEYDGVVENFSSYRSEEDFEKLQMFIKESTTERVKVVSKIPRTLSNIELNRRCSSFPQYKYFSNYYEYISKFSVAWCAQNPYFGYLSGIPYVVSQYGGDTWFEASRGDELGLLMRTSFRCANMFLASNPWNYAHARRLGFKNLIQLPMILDEKLYVVEKTEYRDEWKKKWGGSFFVFSSQRIDDSFKGNAGLLNVFLSLIDCCEGIRFVLMDWGEDTDKLKKAVEKNEKLRKKIIFLKVCGKNRLKKYLNASDCYIDQFKLGNYGVGALEAMALGKPIVGRYEMLQYKALFGGEPPMLNVSTKENIIRQIVDLYNNKELLNKTGASSRKWFLEKHSAKVHHGNYDLVMAATAEGISLPAGNPLKKRLSVTEMRYHFMEYMCAPEPFKYII
jgi:glycosyltransferase involved in cell wall biosynthesis